MNKTPIKQLRLIQRIKSDCSSGTQETSTGLPMRENTIV